MGTAGTAIGLGDMAIGDTAIIDRVCIRRVSVLGFVANVIGGSHAGSETDFALSVKR